MPDQKSDAQINHLQEWKLIGLIILSIRFVSGWIFWGGGSRRFIYAPEKLDPYASTWMANKVQSAMPGALLDVGSLLSALLQHPMLLYLSIIAFSLVELFCGLGLLFGFFSRLAGIVSVLLSINLMVLFGWQGSTCLDEWTMAVSSLAMGFTIALAGSPVYSIDHWLLRRYPSLAERWWFRNFNSFPLSYSRIKTLSLFYLAFTVLFTLLTYNYYRGAIYSKYHSGPVNAVIYNVALKNAVLQSDGSVHFDAYINAGDPAAPSVIVRVELVNTNHELVELWKMDALSKLPASNVVNKYKYNQITVGQYGLVIPVSAEAKITLPASEKYRLISKGNYQLNVYTINGEKFSTPLIFP